MRRRGSDRGRLKPAGCDMPAPPLTHPSPRTGGEGRREPPHPHTGEGLTDQPDSRRIMLFCGEKATSSVRVPVLPVLTGPAPACYEEPFAAAHALQEEEPCTHGRGLP